MILGRVPVPEPENEPVLEYRPGSPEKTELKGRLQELLGQELEIPLIIGGKEVRTGNLARVVCPHDHGHLLARCHLAGPKEVELAAAAAQEAWDGWSAMDWPARLAVFLKAAELLASSRRSLVNGSTMLGQSKTVHQAEIDAACELIDFLRFNACFASQAYALQPRSSAGTWNYSEMRPLEGFVLAVSPFNFTSIAGNLPTAPAMMGNTVLWKPASGAVYSAFFLMRLWEEAGLPPGVINFLPGPGGEAAGPALAREDLAGIHFTGSTAVFQGMWSTVGANIGRYRSYPRLVGETGGKDFILAHASAEPQALATALTRGAFEYQGQKCSAASRAYVPDSLWPGLKGILLDQISRIKVGQVTDFTVFMGALIDRAAFERVKGYIDLARTSPDHELVSGGGGDGEQGYFIRPTLVRALEPKTRLMSEEIFGPVLTVFVYPEKRFQETLELCESTSPYGLTGAVFATDRAAVSLAAEKLRYAAGNFYINDKPTGAVVGQQPFGGARASGTNDKAGSILNLLRWASPRSIKETFNPPLDFAYPFMEEG